jgi:hypothetical protein
MISRSMEYCPQCGVRDPAGYNIQAPAVGQVEGRKRSNFLVPFLGIFDLTAPAACIRRDLPRLVARQQLGCRSPAGLLLKIDVGKRLAVAELLQKPQCNEAQYRDEVKRN